MDAWMVYASGDSARARGCPGSLSRGWVFSLVRRGMCFWRERIFKKMNGIGDDDGTMAKEGGF